MTFNFTAKTKNKKRDKDLMLKVNPDFTLNITLKIPVADFTQHFYFRIKSTILYKHKGT